MDKRRHISGGADTYSAAQVVGKELQALKPTPLYRYVGGPLVYTVPVGGSVGVVYSYTGGQNGAPLWWMFYDKDGKTYYAKHEQGAFNVPLGAKTVEQIEAEEKAKQAAEKWPWEQGGAVDDISKTVKQVGTAVIWGVGIFAAFQVYKIVKSA